MPTDEERLVVRIEAQLRQFERQMARANGVADRSAQRIERRFQAMDSRLGVIGRGIGRSLLAPLAAFASAREIGQAVDAYTRIENALKVVGLEGENAAGVFDQLFAAAQKNFAPVEALVDLYRAGALAQKELNVTSQELINFTEGVAAALKVSGKSAGESRGALIQLSQAIGAGVVRAEEFNAILEGALPIAQAAARGLKEAGGSVSALRRLIIDGKVSSEAFFRAFEAGQPQLEEMAATVDLTLAGALTKVQNSFIQVIGKINETTNVTPALIGALEGIASAFDALPGLVDKFRSSLEALNDSSSFMDRLIITQDEAARIKEAWRNNFGAVPEIAEEAADRSEAAATRIAAAFEVAQGQQTVSLRDFAPPSKTGGGRSKRSPQEQFGEDIARIRERTEALRLEAETIGLTAFEQERALAVQNLLNEAKRAGVAITPELTARINEEANAYARASEALERAQEQQRQFNELAAFTGDNLIQAFHDLVPAIETGNAALDGLINRLIDAALQATLLGSGPLAGLLGGGGNLSGGGIGGIIGRLFGGFRANGGPVSPGRAYVVGERRPEVFVPNVAGVIRPSTGVGGGMVETSIRVEPSPFFITTVDSRVRASEDRMASRFGPGAQLERQLRSG